MINCDSILIIAYYELIVVLMLFNHVFLFYFAKLVDYAFIVFSNTKRVSGPIYTRILFNAEPEPEPNPNPA